MKSKQSNRIVLYFLGKILCLLILIGSLFTCQNGTPVFTEEIKMSDQFMAVYQKNDLLTLADSSNLQLDTLIEKLYALQPHSDKYLMQAVLVKANDLSNLLNYPGSNEMILVLFDQLTRTDRDTSVRFLFAELHSLLGYNFDRMEKYGQAINHYEKSKLLYEEEKMHVEMVGQLGNQSLSYTAIGNFEKAIEASNKGKYILDTISRPGLRAMTMRMHNKMTRANAYNFRAKQYMEMGQFELMRDTLNEAIKIYRSLSQSYLDKENIPPQIYILYGGLATSYNILATQDISYADSSIFYLNKIIPTYKGDQSGLIQPELLGYFQATQASNYFLQGKKALCFQGLNDALNSLNYQQYKQLWATEKTMEFYHPNSLYLAFVLGIKGAMYFKHFQDTGEVEFLNICQEVYREATAIIMRLSLDYTSENLLTSHRARVDDMFRNYTFSYLEKFRGENLQDDFIKALEISDRYKNLILRNGLNRQLLSYEQKGEREALIKKEQKLQQRRRSLVQQLEAEPLDRLEIIDSLLLLQKEENKFLNGLKTSDSPITQQFYKSRYDTSMPSLSEIQKGLGDNKAIIEYYFSGAVPVAMIITNKSIGFILLEDIDEGFYQTAEELMQKDFPFENIDNYRKNAAEIYRRIFKEVEPRLGPEINELILIPDNVLRGIPFDALLYEEPDPKTAISDYPFLLNKYAISYIYSISVYNLSEQAWAFKAGKNNLNFAGFNASPNLQTDTELSFYEGCSLESLDYLTGITADIAELFPKEKRKIFPKASKQDFVKNAPSADILYMAMHGCTEGRAPLDYGLQFIGEKNNLLTINEILDLSLNAKLIVLGSCETENLQSPMGEGLASIARAFRRSGCLNLIASQNVVNDKFGATILKEFHYNWIKEGDNTAVALANAKRKFLKSDAFKSGDKFPSKWAGLISVGKPILWKD